LETQLISIEYLSGFFKTTLKIMKAFFTLLITLWAAISFAQKPIAVLFIGNSYTYGNTGKDNPELPRMLRQMAQSQGITLETDAVVPGGFTLRRHWEQGLAAQKIKSKEWDFVVLQGNSLEAVQRPDEFKAYAMKFDSLIKTNGSKTMLYMTWGRAFRPKMIDSVAMQYEEIGQVMGAAVVPCGLAWKTALAKMPDINLFQFDLSHPTVAGSYLNASQFYKVLFGQDPGLLTFNVSETELPLSSELRKKLQSVQPYKKPIPLTPFINSTWWQVTKMPDLKEMSGPIARKQHIVDHGFVRAKNGKWQLWACIRGTKIGRFFYGWEADSINQPLWKEKGIVLRADSTFGERVKPDEIIQAPYFFQTNDKYYCIYNSAGQIRLMDSEDGEHYKRMSWDGKNYGLFAVAGTDQVAGRDPMLFVDDGTYYVYVCQTVRTPDNFSHSFVTVRYSKDLKNWGDFSIVNAGGKGGNGPVSAESPFVVKLEGYYYLFRASSITFKTYVYRSESPFDFGTNTDDKLVAEFPIKAPELIFENNQWYISDLSDFQGIKMAKLTWR
jgi:hypothetical protein